MRTHTLQDHETIELACCRCKAAVTLTAGELDEHERESRVVLCKSCKDARFRERNPWLKLCTVVASGPLPKGGPR